MITKFDKGAKAQYYKHEFAECIDDGNYEGALDNLLKYVSETDYPDFHLTCGILYLQMTQESDDSELYSMALHEFLMHVRRFPDWTDAYRYILAALFLRGNFPQAIAACRWIRRRGIDLGKIINELAEDGILYLSPSEPADIDGMIDLGEYGGIDPCPAYVGEEGRFGDVEYLDAVKGVGRKKPLSYDMFIREEIATAEKYAELLNGKSKLNPTKVVKFASSEVQEPKEKPKMQISYGEAIKFVPKTQNPSLRNFRFVLEKIEKDLDGGTLDERDFEEFETAIPADESVLEELHKRLMQEFVFKTEDDYNDKNYGGGDDGAPDIYEDFPPEYLHEEIDTGDVHRITGADKPSKAIDVALYYYENGDDEKVLETINGIPSDSPDAYKALVIYAMLELDWHEYSAAEAHLKRAMEIDERNPLAPLLLTEIYEDKKQYKKIPPLLKAMDIDDFASVRHVQKVARLATSYCKREEAMDIISELIEEYNIASLRLIYAQMLYNSGKREEALDEMYDVSRLYYNDVNTELIYGLMREDNAKGKYKLNETREAPTEVMSAIYDDLIFDVLHGRVSKEKAGAAEFNHIVNGFIGLAYSQPADLLCDMFKTLVGLTENQYTREITVDALTDPYTEAIAKFVILATLLEHDKKAEYVLEVNYSIVSHDTVPVLDEKYPEGYATAYAFMLAFCKSGIDEFFSVAEKTFAASGQIGFACKDIAYYLIKKTAKKCKYELDERLVYALGFSDDGAAEKTYKEICSVLKKVQRS